MSTFSLSVVGPYACFTRPEMKVERVSYDVMTPSAARSIFESILWKPQMRWRVLRIEVLKPVRWINLRRNEVNAVISNSNVRQAMNAGQGALGMYIEEERQQRAGYFLRDVGYRVHAQLSLVPGWQEPLVKYTEMFVRRASKGQCVNQPYLGCREFAADVRLITQDSPRAQPIEDTRELGWMLHDLDFTNASDPKPRFFRAKMNAGVVEVPPFEEALG
jgi:CRISPR-associated protein Cas5d